MSALLLVRKLTCPLQYIGQIMSTKLCFYAETLYQVLIIYIEMFLYLMGKWPIATEFVSFLLLDILWEFQENLQF